MKKYLATLLVVMVILGGGLSICFGLGSLLKFLIFDKCIDIWLIFLAYIFILSIIITTINYFVTKKDKGDENDRTD